jgi:type VI secretion system protein ImpG
MTDAHHPEFYQVYSILGMHMIREKTNQEQSYTPVLPFFAMSHYQQDQTQFFYALSPKQLKSDLIEMGYSIISKALNRMPPNLILLALSCCVRIGICRMKHWGKPIIF